MDKQYLEDQGKILERYHIVLPDNYVNEIAAATPVEMREYGEAVVNWITNIADGAEQVGGLNAAHVTTSVINLWIWFMTNTTGIQR